MARQKTKLTMSLISIACLMLFIYLAKIWHEDDQVPESEPTIIVDASEQSEEPAAGLESIPSAADQSQDEFMTEALSEQIQWVAQAYAEQAKYPAYSVVVSDIELATSPPPFQQARVEMKTFDDDGNVLPTSIAASVDKLNYVVGEAITLQVQVLGASAFSNIYSTANLKALNGSALMPNDLDLIATNAEQTEFRVSVDSSDIDLKGASQELVARIEVQINGEDYVTTVPFFLSKASALLESVGTSEQREAHLEIPLQYDVYESGYYFVSGYLDDARTGRPLLALQTEGRMSKGSDELILKAHHQALKDAGSAGPYQLRITSSYRGAEPGEGEDILTAVSQKAFPIPDFSFDGYADIPFSDPLVEERLQALRKLSSKGK